ERISRREKKGDSVYGPAIRFFAETFRGLTIVFPFQTYALSTWSAQFQRKRKKFTWTVRPRSFDVKELFPVFNHWFKTSGYGPRDKSESRGLFEDRRKLQLGTRLTLTRWAELIARPTGTRED